jgi:hypothetical protein
VPLGSGTAVCFNLATLKKFDIVRKAFGISPEQSVFVVPVFSGEFAPVLRDLGVKDYFVAPVVAEVLWAAVGAARTRSVEAGWQGLPPRQRDSLNASRRTFRGLFDGVRNGGRRPGGPRATSRRLRHGARGIAVALAFGHVGHHDYTLPAQHVRLRHHRAFRPDMGRRRRPDAAEHGGMLHDIGKALIPLAY